MIERTAASICIASITIGGIFGFILIWGPQSRLLGNLLLSCLVLFLASGSIFSISTTLRARRQGDR
jgi:hypothetical protein